ncbi:MAG: hypothetical protein R3327_06530 [Nitrosopumilaceae archaeon]|nr:hypothetical protein [Nitrosopumilaceae archaeon]
MRLSSSPSQTAVTLITVLGVLSVANYFFEKRYTIRTKNKKKAKHCSGINKEIHDKMDLEFRISTMMNGGGIDTTVVDIHENKKRVGEGDQPTSKNEFLAEAYLQTLKRNQQLSDATDLRMRKHRPITASNNRNAPFIATHGVTLDKMDYMDSQIPDEGARMYKKYGMKLAKKGREHYIGGFNHRYPSRTDAPYRNLPRN